MIDSRSRRNSSIDIRGVFEDQSTSSGGVPQSQNISECQYNNPRQTLVVASHQNCVNDHNELDTVCPRYNAVFGVHDIEPRCEARYRKCVALAVHVQTYTVYTKCAMSLSIVWKIHHVTSVGI